VAEIHGIFDGVVYTQQKEQLLLLNKKLGGFEETAEFYLCKI